MPFSHTQRRNLKLMSKYTVTICKTFRSEDPENTFLVFHGRKKKDGSLKHREHDRLLVPHQRGGLFSFFTAVAPLVATLHVIRWQHAGLAGALHGAVHPALVNGLSVDDDIAVPEGDLVVVLGRVVVQCPVNTLQTRRQWGQTKTEALILKKSFISRDF